MLGKQANKVRQSRLTLRVPVHVEVEEGEPRLVPHTQLLVEHLQTAGLSRDRHLLQGNRGEGKKLTHGESIPSILPWQHMFRTSACVMPCIIVLICYISYRCYVILLLLVRMRVVLSALSDIMKDGSQLLKPETGQN